MRKVLLPIAATTIAPLVAAAPAQANSGSMESSVYYNTVMDGVLQTWIQNKCDCTGTTTTYDANDKAVTYTANNATFELCIAYTVVRYHQNQAGEWRAYEYKRRVTCAGTAFTDWL